jgi:SH3-like domain-containing protein
MNHMFRSSILTAAALTVLVVPALAETVTCTVTAPEIRVRKSPSKKAHVVAILKKGERTTTSGKCDSGWVKVASEDGSRTGYVAGWALSDTGAKVAAAPAAVEGSKVEAAPVAVQKEIPNNEQLAIQITQLRLNVLGLDRDVQKMKKDIQKIKVAVGSKSQSKKSAANVKKDDNHLAKK